MDWANKFALLYAKFGGGCHSQDRIDEALEAPSGKHATIDLMLQQFLLRGCLTAAYRISADSILGIAKRFWDLMPLR